MSSSFKRTIFPLPVEPPKRTWDIRKVDRYRPHDTLAQRQHKFIARKVAALPRYEVWQIALCGNRIKKNVPFALFLPDVGDGDIERRFDPALFILPLLNGDPSVVKGPYCDTGMLRILSLAKQTG